MSLSVAYQNVEKQVFDAVVIGGGYAGYAAAMRLAGRGKRVLVVERRAALLHESGWGFSLEVGKCDAPEWGALMGRLTSRNGARGGFVDGAIAEVVGADELVKSGVSVLFYMQPVEVWRDGEGRIGAVALAGKGGVKVVRGRAWIDATDEGELMAVLSADWNPPAPSRRVSNLFFRNAAWADGDEAEYSLSGWPGAKVKWGRTMWDNERVLSLDLPGETERPRSAWRGALEMLHGAQPGRMKGAVVTNASAEAVGVYAGVALQAGDAPVNVAWTMTGDVRTLGDRFARGVTASEAVLTAKPQAGKPQAGREVPFEFGREMPTGRRIGSEVVVAGLGTGGVFAAIAAGRAGAKVLGFDPLPFAGGIGTGGGIHSYYYGAKGGMQEEIDQRIRAATHLFGGVKQVAGFHPDAKKMVLEECLAEAGVELMMGATLFGVEAREGLVRSARVATMAGPMMIESGEWIDATGDGDLCASAGAGFDLGRMHDGQLHAYSQSSGKAVVNDEGARMQVINYDAGFVDPTDAEDLTRARLVGVGHYLQKSYGEIERPTYIAPALGLRQGRQIKTRYRVTLADLIERRRFADCIGLTGAHYDNHAVDYEFESDEGMFWVWGCRQWRSGRTACEMPYRMLLPEGLENVWIACRAAGVSEEAHHSLRMQRDFQRLGEVAGIASAMAARSGARSGAVDYGALRAELEKSGAVGAAVESGDGFGAAPEQALFGDAAESSEEAVGVWMESVRKDFGVAMYRLMRAGSAIDREGEGAGPEPSGSREKSRAGVKGLLKSADGMVRWRGAMIAGMWGDCSAEGRLLEALRGREYGYGPDEKNRPETHNRVVPNWVVAVAMLRRCGTAACLGDLWEMSKDRSLLHNQRTTLAITCQHLLERLKLTEMQKGMLLETVRRLLETPAGNSAGNPQRRPVVIDEPPTPGDQQRQPVVEDFGWQLHLAVAKAEEAAGAPVHEGARVYLSDPRVTVRKAFTGVLQQY